MTSTAFKQAARTGIIDGPLQGYHREWYVVRPDGELSGLGRVKIGEPREGVLWFDRRYFTAEDELLLLLPQFGVPGVPPVRRVGAFGLVIHGFVEGQELSVLCPTGTVVQKHYLDQIMAVFAGLAHVEPHAVRELSTQHADDEDVWDSPQFLAGLIRFTREQAFKARQPEFGDLFDQLGIPATALGADSWLFEEAAQLSSRPFRLLHGDLHRANFIVDDADRLWTIDWELAAVGDPLYDLATHLYLMKYPPDQEHEVTERWRTTMSKVLPDAVIGLRADLPRYLEFKRAQSVFTDVVRHAIAVRECVAPAQLADQLQRTAKTIEGVLARARDCLSLDVVPSSGVIESVYADFWVTDQQ